MSDITTGAIVIHHGAVSYGRGKVVSLLEAGGIPLARVQFDGGTTRPVRVAHLSVERSLPMAVRLPVTPKLRVVYSADRATPVELPAVVA